MSGTVPNIDCLVCGASNQWSRPPLFVRHVKNVKNCSQTEGAKAQPPRLTLGQIALDSTVVHNLRRLQVQQYSVKQGRKKV